MLIITHNFGVVAEICDRVSVMYAGRIVESGPVLEIFKHPRHPYTQDLIASIPSARQGAAEERHAEGNTVKKRLATIPGAPPDLREEIKGCPYAPRCKRAQKQCFEALPAFLHGVEGHSCACILKD